MKVSLAIAALLGYTSAIQLEGNNLSQVHQEVKSLVEKQMSEEIKAAATPEDAAKKDADLQHRIDEILDKISSSGYESLSKDEKDFLFRAGKK